MIIIKFPIIWILIFLLHEYMHIKSQGILMKGEIWIDKFGFKCTADEVKNQDLYSISGGLFSGIVSFILAFTPDTEFQFCFITLGFVQVFYGIYEWLCDKYGYDLNYRYGIYIIVVATALFIWWYL